VQSQKIAAGYANNEIQQEAVKIDMIKHKWGIMNKLGKLEKKVKRNYVAHKGEMSF